MNFKNINFTLAFYLSIHFFMYSPTANAECEVSGRHRHCAYYVDTDVAAQNLCSEKVIALRAQGYFAYTDLCGFGYTNVDGVVNYRYSKSWMEEIVRDSNDYRFQAVTVAWDSTCDGSIDVDSGVCNPPDVPKKDQGCTGPNGEGNPCNVATGNKYQSETDFVVGGMTFTRAYNSLNLTDTGLGRGWRHNHQKKLIVSENELTQVSSTGRGELWVKTNGDWHGDADSNIIISETNVGFQLTKANGVVEAYNENGQIQSITDTNGYQTTYAYNSDETLNQVSNHYGQSLSFSYSNGKLSRVTDAFGAAYHYEFGLNSNLVGVSYPDETDDSSSDNPKRTYHYEREIDYPNHLTGITDENGDRYATWNYDSNGRAILSKHAETSTANVGQETFVFEHDYQNANAAGTMVTDAVGTNELWTFDEVLGAQKLVSKVNQIDGKGFSQTWDASGNKLSRTDAEGRVTTYAYNATNQRVSMTEASGTSKARSTSFEYLNADIDLLTKTISESIYSSNLKEVVNTYDANKNLIAVTVNGFDSAGSAVIRTTTFDHDVYGNVIEINGPRTDVNDITVLEYHDCDTGTQCGQLKAVTNAVGHTSSYDSYDAASRLTQSTDPNGIVTSYTYHSRGWLLSRTQTPPTGAVRVTTYEYDNVGQLTKITLPDGNEQNYVYDAAHDLREVFDNLGNRVNYTYDAKGNRTHELVYDPDGTLVLSTVTNYDIRNFIASVNRDGSVTQMINDAVGNQSTQVDPNTNPTAINSFDALDRLTNTVDALSNNSSYVYDIEDQLISVHAPNGVVTSYEYDDLGNMTRETSADRGVTNYVHDAAGNVIRRTDARGIVVNYGYDALNRLISVDYPGVDEDVILTYDSAELVGDNCGFGIGLLCKVSDQAGDKLYVYDAFSNVIRWHHIVDQHQFTWRAEYDKYDRLMSLIYPEGRVLTIGRDAAGRLTDLDSKLNGAPVSIISGRTYRADGLRTAHLLGNAVQDVRTYDRQGRLTDISGSSVFQKSLSYDLNGNIIQTDDPNDAEQYQYDVLDRLTGSFSTTETSEFLYDANGNRIDKAVNGAMQSSLYVALSNQQSSVNGSPVQLDAAGNTVSDQGGARVYTYNQAGRIASITNQLGLTGQYTYGHDGLRATKTLSDQNSVTIFQYDLNGKLLAEANSSGRVIKEYVYADEELVAVIERDPDTPIVTAPSDTQVEASAILTPVALSSAMAVDINGSPLTAVPNNTGPYPLGSNTITWSASVGSVQGYAVQNLEIVDTTSPVITAPANIIVYDVNDIPTQIGEVMASDIFGVTVSNNLPSTFSNLHYRSDLEVIWRAEDASGNYATDVQLITLMDPSLSCLATAISANGTASQSSTHQSDIASKAINSVFTDSASTSTIDTNASWQLDYDRDQAFASIKIHNRSIYKHWLRDLLVSVEDSNGTQVYESELLNPENALNGPASIQLDLPLQAVGSRIKIRRVYDADLSGGGVSVFEGYLLSIAEVEVQGCPAPQAAEAPVVMIPESQSLSVGDSFSYQVVANDLNGDALTYSATGLPSGLSIDTQTGNISGAALQAGISSVSVTVSDGLLSATVSFDINVVHQLCSGLSNIGSNGTASQSSTHQSDIASKAINSVFTDSASTSTIDTNASWQLDYDRDQAFASIKIHNRSIYKHWLRDLLVSVEDSNGTQVYESELLNPENALNGPASIQLDLPPQTVGSRIEIRRVHDADLSGGGTAAYEGYLLSIAEVDVQGCVAPQSPAAPAVQIPEAQTAYVGANFNYSYQIIATDSNDDTLTYSAMGLPSGVAINALTGEISGAPLVAATSSVSVTVSDGVLSSTVSFALNSIDHLCSSTSSIGSNGTASQSSTHQSEVASKAINGIFTDSAHTTTSDTNARWQLDFTEDQVFDSVVIHNRSIYKHWLRDLYVSVEDDSGAQVYESQLLNPENTLNGPSSIQLDLPPQTVGSRIKIRRVHDTDLSGGGGSVFEGFILATSEVDVQGCVAPQGGQ